VSAVPEPAAWALLLAGMASIIGFAVAKMHLPLLRRNAREGGRIVRKTTSQHDADGV